jgi:hypothetical protein
MKEPGVGRVYYYVSIRMKHTITILMVGYAYLPSAAFPVAAGGLSPGALRSPVTAVIRSCDIKQSADFAIYQP